MRRFERGFEETVALVRSPKEFNDVAVEKGARKDSRVEVRKVNAKIVWATLIAWCTLSRCQCFTLKKYTVSSEQMRRHTVGLKYYTWIWKGTERNGSRWVGQDCSVSISQCVCRM